VAGTHHSKIHTQILSDPSWRVNRTRGSRYPRVFPRVYSRVPVEDPDSCPALPPLFQWMPGLLIEASFHPLGEPHGIAHGCLPRSQYPIYNPGDIMDVFLIYNIPQIMDGIHRFQSTVLFRPIVHAMLCVVAPNNN